MNWRTILLIEIILLLDQLTKLAAEKLLTTPIVLVQNFLLLQLGRNSGSGFGMFQGTGTLLMVLGLAAICILIYSRRSFMDSKAGEIAFALILAGIAGNTLDRFLFGAVTDFISPTFFPAFNVADSAMSCGVALFLLASFLHKKN